MEERDFSPLGIFRFSLEDYKGLEPKEIIMISIAVLVLTILIKKLLPL